MTTAAWPSRSKATGPTWPVERAPPPVGCEYSNKAFELRVCSDARVANVAPLLPPPEATRSAATTCLPDAVPLHPAPRPTRPRRRRQGPGDPGPAPAAHRPATPAPTTQAGTRRPCPARRSQPRPTTRPLVVLLRHPRHPAALASPPGRRRMDPPTSRPRTTAAGRRGPAADHPPGHREPALGLPAPQGRTPAAWRARLRHRNPVHAAPPRAGPGAATHDHHLAEVPAPAGRRDPRVRLLHRRHRLAAPALRAVLHRTRQPTGPPGRGDRQPRRRLGRSAGP